METYTNGNITNTKNQGMVVITKWRFKKSIEWENTSKRTKTKQNAIL